MNRSRRSIVALAVVFLGLFIAVRASAAEKQLKIVTTIFPEYDWVMNILGDQADSMDVIWMMDAGVDLHSFNPSIEDIVDIDECDLFIYVGGESDFWVEDVLRESTKEGRKTVRLLDLLAGQVKEEEIITGMQVREAEEESEEEPEYDEHVWLSLRNAEVIVGGLADILGGIDPEHAEEYSANADTYKKALQELDDEYTAALEAAAHKTLVMGDRFPFRYLFDDYSLSCYAAFNGCSAESEASFETIIFLAEKMDELNLRNILKTENDNTRICETVIESTKTKNQEILTIDSMQSVTRENYENGTTYLTKMQENLETLKKATE